MASMHAGQIWPNFQVRLDRNPIIPGRRSGVEFFRPAFTSFPSLFVVGLPLFMVSKELTRTADSAGASDPTVLFDLLRKFVFSAEKGDKIWKPEKMPN